MTIELKNMASYEPPLTAEAKAPITVDWSTTIQSLSTDLQGYDVSLELTATSEMFTNFFDNEGVFRAKNRYTL